jgi:hypothetical protein
VVVVVVKASRPGAEKGATEHGWGWRERGGRASQLECRDINCGRGYRRARVAV